MSTTPWPTEDVEKLKRLFENGLSQGTIAAQFAGKYSRRAIGGKARRVGLVSRPKPGGFALPSNGAQRNKTKTPPVKIVDTEETLVPIGLVNDFPAKWRNSGCREMLAHKDGWQLCGHSGEPYCLVHRKKNTQPQTGKSSIDPAILLRSGINRALG